MSETKEHIIDKSYELFISHSYEAVSISDISKAIGMTKGALYHHFLNKEELFKAVVDKHLILPTVACNLDQVSLKELFDYNIRCIRELLDSYLSYSNLFTPLNFVSLFGDASRHYKGFIEKTERYVKDEEKKIVTVLENAIKRGEIRSDINVAITAYTIISLYVGLVGNLIVNSQDVDKSFSLLRSQILEFYKMLKKST